MGTKRRKTIRRYPPYAKQLLLEANNLISAGRRLQRLAEKVADAESLALAGERHMAFLEKHPDA